MAIKGLPLARGAVKSRIIALLEKALTHLAAAPGQRSILNQTPKGSNLSGFDVYRRTGCTPGPRAGHLLFVDVPAFASGLAKLLNLAVKGLPVGRDAGIADQPFFGEFRSYLLQRVTH